MKDNSKWFKDSGEHRLASTNLLVFRLHVKDEGWHYLWFASFTFGASFHEVFAGLFLFGAQISGCHSATLRLHVTWPGREAWLMTSFPLRKYNIMLCYGMPRNVYNVACYVLFRCCCRCCSCCCSFDCAHAKPPPNALCPFACRCRCCFCCRWRLRMKHLKSFRNWILAQHPARAVLIQLCLMC